MVTTFNVLIFLLYGIIATGSLLSLSSHPHWFFRIWDFPRTQIIVICAIAACSLFAVNAVAGTLTWQIVASALTIALSISIWHLSWIFPYTPLASQQAKDWSPRTASKDAEGRRLRLLISNVQMGNAEYHKWRSVVDDCKADVVIAAEVDARWLPTLKDLQSFYPHQIIQPQDNCYGMALLSRLPFASSQLRFLVEDDIPSIDTLITLPGGDHVRVIGVHPRPPEPIRGTDAVGRDAELALWGEELSEEERPTVIGGDLNDVAWSETTALFLRLSQLLDPRRGRGLFNSFHARKVWMRFPLDHVFHSAHFKIREIRRLGYVGSDHFPILIDLQLEPEAEHEQEPLEEKSDDEAEAQERIERAENKESVKV